jgi:hypothetical protein
MKYFSLTFACLLFSVVSFSQTVLETRENSPKFEIPNIPGYYTLKCDFHMHTIFSDGKVWPDVRVNEAIFEGLDVIAITDHVEKKTKGVDDNHVMGYHIAKKAAEVKELIVIPGGELSASKDHYNALFLTNQDEPILRDKTPAIRIKGANEQGGIVFWNHPGRPESYKNGNAPTEGELIPLLSNGQVKGIEICNGDSYYEGAHKMALENNLTIVGNSDMHGLSYYMHDPLKHRTITLVFAKEKSVEEIKKALLNQRTVIYRGKDLIGSEEYLRPLFMESVEVKADYREEITVGEFFEKNPKTDDRNRATKAYYRDGITIAYVELINNSDFDFYCDYKGPFKLYNAVSMVSIPAHSSTVIGVKTNEILDSFNINFVIHNAIIAPGEKLKVKIPVKI